MLLKSVGVVISFLLFSFTLSLASETSIPRSGQWTSYAAGDDGALRTGVPWPDPRFTDNDNGTVTDNLTGLIWLKNATCFGKQTWGAALTNANNLASGACGLSDGSFAGQWRLPTRREMDSLIDASMSSPALPAHYPFSNIQIGNYWSSSTYLSQNSTNGSSAWFVNIAEGNHSSLDKISWPSYVWPVRGGQSSAPAKVQETGQTTSYAAGDDGALTSGVSWPSPRFTDNGNGTVTDNLTGLIWLKQASCTETVGGVTRTGALVWSDAVTWSNAMANGYCGLSDDSTVGDWRLPSRLELFSLVDTSRYLPVLPAGHPFSGVLPYYNYWSSTTGSSYSLFAWLLSMQDGDITSANKSAVYTYAWPVRGGQFGSSLISVSPLAKNFGTVAVGESSNQIITISNGSNATSRLQINAITLRGADSSQFGVNVGNGSSGTCGSSTPILPPGASCTVTVSFTPTSAGARSVNLRISGSDAENPNIDVVLASSSGTAVTSIVSGGNGTISSANTLYVTSGSTASFTLSPFPNYRPSSTVTGSCPAGSWSDNTYTTGIILADCNVDFSFVKIAYPLTIFFQGTSGGTITVLPKPPAINCSGNCSQSFDSGTLVTLYPVTDGSSIFSGWNGCSVLTNDQCSLTMNAAKSVTAFFNLAVGDAVKVGGNLYGTITGSASVVADGGELSLKTGSIYESINFNRAVVITLKGGYSSDFLATTGTTSIHGSITIAAGTVTFDGIVIQ